MVSEYKLTRVGLNGILSKNNCGTFGNRSTNKRN